MLWGRCTAHKNEEFSGFFRKQFNPDDCHVTKQIEPSLPLQPGKDISIGQVLLLQPWWPCGSPCHRQPTVPLPRHCGPHNGGMDGGDGLAFFRGGNDLVQSDKAGRESMTKSMHPTGPALERVARGFNDKKKGVQ